MNFNNGLGAKAIQDVMQSYPEIVKFWLPMTSVVQPARWGSVC